MPRSVEYYERKLLKAKRRKKDKTADENQEPVPVLVPEEETVAVSLPEEEVEEPQIDPEYLAALGEPAVETIEVGEEISPILAQRWSPILKTGLDKDARDKIIKEYPVPANCTLLRAPKLNPEISAAVTDMARNRDVKMANQQQQLGAGLTAINKGITCLLTGGPNANAIRLLSDSCRILADLHQQHTTIRKKMIIPSLDKVFNTIVQDSERDATLFGEGLQDKIRTSKTIEKQGLQIKKPTLTAIKPIPPNVRRVGNWPAPPPPRYPYPQQFQPQQYQPHQYSRAGRGGGGQRRMTMIGQRFPNPIHRPASHSKQPPPPRSARY